MALEKIDIPFNKDQATISMGKDAITSLEGLFEIMERESLSDEERAQWVAGHAEAIYESWVRNYPRKDG